MPIVRTSLNAITLIIVKYWLCYCFCYLIGFRLTPALPSVAEKKKTVKKCNGNLLKRNPDQFNTLLPC